MKAQAFLAHIQDNPSVALANVQINDGAQALAYVAASFESCRVSFVELHFSRFFHCILDDPPRPFDPTWLSKRTARPLARSITPGVRWTIPASSHFPFEGLSSEI